LFIDHKAKCFCCPQYNDEPSNIKLQTSNLKQAASSATDELSVATMQHHCGNVGKQKKQPMNDCFFIK
jgi:hypothetical protein